MAHPSESMPKVADLPSECDWGYCNRPSLQWRWDDGIESWLPVCGVHTVEAEARAAREAEARAAREADIAAIVTAWENEEPFAATNDQIREWAAAYAAEEGGAE